MRLIDADELITAFPSGESVRTESVRATINHMPTIEVSEDCISRAWVQNKLTEYVKDYALNELDSWQNTIVEWIATDIEDAPSVVPSRPEGEWVDLHNGKWKCSECGTEVIIYAKGNYCPNCGCKMKGAEE